MRIFAQTCLFSALCLIATAEAQLFNRFGRGGWTPSVRPPVFQGPVAYRGIAVTSSLPGSEPAAGQLRAYPLLAGPPAVAGVPGDPTATYVAPYQPDVTFVGPAPYVAGYAGLPAAGGRTLLPPPPGGVGLPLVLHGGFAEAAMPVVDGNPAYQAYSGYYGTLMPVYATPIEASPSLPIEAGH